MFAKFLDEAVGKLARLHGSPQAHAAFERAPAVIAGYSGGYNPAAFALAIGGVNQRVHGVMLFDGLFAEIDKFADWLAKRPPAFFFTAYGKAARSEHAELQRHIRLSGVAHCHQKLDGVKKKYRCDAELAYRFTGLNPFVLTAAQRAGLMANLARLEAQDIIRGGQFDPTNYDAVYNLYITAFEDESKAQAAKLKSLERLVRQSCANAIQT